jgi:uncharacterized protein (UPF0371 family)
VLGPGFDNDKYLEEQTQEILKRVEIFESKALPGIRREAFF